MNRPVWAAALSGIALVGVWWVGAAPPQSEPVPTARTTAPPPPVERLATEMQLRTDGLRDHGRLAPIPTGSRNPFRFAGEPPPSARLRAPKPTPAPVVPVTPPEPELRLIGVAENQAGDAIERTAIISGLGQLFLVKPGESVTSRYTVVAIGADAVELRDTETGQPRRIGLR
jgi:hypothetical protein